MKKLFSTILLILAVSYSYAQNTAWPSPTSSNYVGIGTTSPETPLTVSGNNLAIFKGFALSNMSVGNGSGTAFYMGFQADSENPYGIRLLQVGYPSATRSAVFAVQRHGVFGGDTDWLTSLLIDYSGNIGINTSAPAAKLEINSPDATPLKAVGSNGYLLIDNINSGQNYYQANSFHQFQGPGGNAILTIQGTGNVGIGTVNPDARLAVQGTIHATEVLVDQTVPTPDYVFDKDYDLASLKDVKTYIDQNHHLPEIPSAAQVAKEGINLGEMNAKLLKKIEELTLYLIQQKDELSIEKAKNLIQETLIAKHQKQLIKINQRLHIN